MNTNEQTASVTEKVTEKVTERVTERVTEAPSYESYAGTWSSTDDSMMGSMGVQFRAFDGNTDMHKISDSVGEGYDLP